MPDRKESTGAPSREEQIRTWREKADEDEAVVTLIRAAGGPWSMAVYHSQQAAEKLVKALIVAKGSVPPRTHDVALLLQLPIFSDAVPTAVMEAAENLTGYAWLTRYPGGPVTTKATAEDAFADVGVIRDWMKEVAGIRNVD